MATINPANIIQSRFIGSPISVPVTAASPAGNVTFHRVRLRVTIGDGGGVITTGDTTFEFSSPCSNGELVWFDISSAFRAFADAFVPMPAAFSYPHLNAELEAVDDYMIDGVSYEGQSTSGTKQVTGKYLGALSDKERGFGISNSWSEPERYSRKPATSPEIVFAGKSALRPVALMDGVSPQAPDVDVISIADEGAHSAYNCFAVAAPLDGHEIRFVNSLGVHENVFVSGRPTKEVNITTERYAIARQETITQFSRGVAVKQNDFETWTFSTGPLDQAWTSWYIHELLMARWVWLGVGGAWIPCHVLPEETTKMINRADGKLLEVQFVLQLDINGSPV